MAPFLSPTIAISGIKEKPDALAVHGDRLYIGTSVGNLHIYSINDSEDGRTFEPIEIKKALVKKSIEQLGCMKDVNSLVVLSEAVVTLFPLATLSPPTPLVRAKAAFSFGIHASIQDLADVPESSPRGGSTKPKPIPTLFTQLVVGCRRKVVIYSWKDGEPLEPKEAALPHSPRIISFIDHNTACFAYSPTEYAIFSIPALTFLDVTTPVPVSTSTSSGTMGAALTGLTGYMTLGLGAKPKPGAIAVSESEALISKDAEGIVVGVDGKVARTMTIQWAAPPGDLAFIKPYIFAVLPPGSVPDPSSSISTPRFIPTTVVQIYSSLSLLPTQTLPFPFSLSESTSEGTNAATANASIRLLTTFSMKSTLFFVTTSSDKATAAAEGSTVWQCVMKPWSEQIDELIQAECYAGALALLDVLDEAPLEDKASRHRQIRILNAVAYFREGKYDAAMDTFLELDLNPAKVVALFPENVAGRLAVPRDRWIPLFGGPVQKKVRDASAGDEANQGIEKVTADFESGPSLEVRGRRGTVDSLRLLSPPKDKGEGSSTSPSRRAMDAQGKGTSKALEALVRYLSDRRPKLAAALQAEGITPANQSHTIAPLSEIPVEELFALPNAVLSVLTPEQLLRRAQIVDTVLYKSYFIIRPSLVGSLCRVPNWCEVSEVEEDLRVRNKFSELVDLYNGKQMHAKALELLRQLGENEINLNDKLSPSIHYLQKLGPEHLQQIFASGRWIFENDANMAFEIFTSEDVELPRQEVCDYLYGIDPKLCLRYLEYIIQERHEEQAVFHDRLAEMYLTITQAARRRGEEAYRQEAYSKLLHFIDTNDRYSPDLLYGGVSSSDLHEARAILLGRLGRHEEALKLYVYKMKDYRKAEEHCKRVHNPELTGDIFLTLLKLYLRPSPSDTMAANNVNLLSPALDLIARHNFRLDPVLTLQLLPPLVSARDVRDFLLEALARQGLGPCFNAAVVKQVTKAQSESVKRRLIVLQGKRVKIGDSRICPECHKRIGNSVIAVHAPRGEVTHLICREKFANRLRSTWTRENRW